MKRPSFQFYPGDWLHDTALRICSVGARGLWIDMICLMHQCDPYGYLKVNYKVILEVNLAKIVGLTLEEVKGYLSELEDAGVFSKDENGVIFSRRMVRDEILRQKRAEGGKMGGNPQLTESKVNHKDNLKAENKVKQKPTPSFSSSSSSSNNKKENIYSQDAQKVLDYLNKKKGSKYTKKDEIISRFKEGHAVDECITIIDNKFKDSYFLENPDYLNPVTLFRKSHFDNYLNAGTMKLVNKKIEYTGLTAAQRWETEKKHEKEIDDYRMKLEGEKKHSEMTIGHMVDGFVEELYRKDQTITE